jgi:hypothetical protein
MITLLASIAGFISSLLPEIFKIFRDKNDKKHELAIFDRQIELQKAGFTQRIEEIRTANETTEAQVLYSTYKVGVSWVDALNGTVRPILAYSFFLLYASVKLLQYCMIGEHAPLIVYVETLWTENDQAIFAGIISFYYGHRAIYKLRKS